MSGVRARRGRAGAYRWLWQWPLRSPARALLTLTAALTVLGLGALAGHQDPVSQGAPPPLVHPAVPPAAANPARSTPTNTPGAARLEPAPARGSAESVALAWSRAWSTHLPTTTTSVWLDTLRPWTSPEYLGQLATVDMANVPAAQPIGPARLTAHDSDTATVEIALTTLRLQLQLVRTPAGWQVTDATTAR